MSGRFLRAAFRVLDQEVRPLTPEQIVEIAIRKGFLSSVGHTPNHTMRARLSDDIRNGGAESEFVRTGPNRFGLRSWDFSEYHARPFTKGLPDEITVCISGSVAGPAEFRGVGFSQDIDQILKICADPTKISFVPRVDAESTTHIRQLIVYAWLETADGLVLTYRRGKYSSAHKTLLLGKRSVGFGGHVLMQDAENLFGARDGGLLEAGLREIGEELGAAAPRVLVPEGVIWDDTSFEGQKHVGFVVSGRLGHSKDVPIRSNERSINELRLMSRDELWEAFHTMEFWSQLLIREFAGEARPPNISTIVPQRRPRDVKHIALVGEIANGKTSLGSALANRLGYSVISASTALRGLLEVGEFSERTRLQFQSVALEFIQTTDGPARLAAAIAEAAKALSESGPVLFDGIRQRATLAELRALVPNIVVIYVDCPRDMAFRQYQTRLSDATAQQFAAVREHEVESDLPLLRFESDAVFNNADEMEKSIGTLIAWLTSERK